MFFADQKYLHESRHKHAMNRVRGEGGRFHSKDSVSVKSEKDLYGIKVEKSHEDNSIAQLLTSVSTDASLVTQVRAKTRT